MRRVKVFLGFSHQDAAWITRLARHLNVLGKQGLVEIWTDRRIQAGAGWLKEILRAIEEAKVVVLLVSADFLTSDFIMDVEILRILERREAGELQVVPVLVEPCAWKAVPWLAEMQMRPSNGVSLAELPAYQQEAQFAAITEEILDLVAKLLR